MDKALFKICTALKAITPVSEYSGSSIQLLELAFNYNRDIYWLRPLADAMLVKILCQTTLVEELEIKKLVVYGHPNNLQSFSHIKFMYEAYLLVHFNGIVRDRLQEISSSNLFLKRIILEYFPEFNQAYHIQIEEHIMNRVSLSYKKYRGKREYYHAITNKYQHRRVIN
jgi:hypothetical protein